MGFRGFAQPLDDRTCVRYHGVIHAAGPRILGAPKSARIATDDAGLPRSLDGRTVASVRDEWRVDEGWWTGRPVRRRYFDVVLEDGRNAVVFCDRHTGRWFTQRG